MAFGSNALNIPWAESPPRRHVRNRRKEVFSVTASSLDAAWRQNLRAAPYPAAPCKFNREHGAATALEGDLPIAIELVNERIRCNENEFVRRELVLLYDKRPVRIAIVHKRDEYLHIRFARSANHVPAEIRLGLIGWNCRAKWWRGSCCREAAR